MAGIEIENTIGADVYGNTTEDNTGGMLVFTLPNLPKKEGRQCRVFGNEIRANNRENFARPGQMAGNIPPGSGLLCPRPRGAGAGLEGGATKSALVLYDGALARPAPT